MTYFITGTGPRKLKTNPADWAKIADSLEKFLIENHLYTNDLAIIAGGAEGFDELLAWTAYEMEIPYVLALPNTSYGAYYWGKKSVTGHDRTEDFNQMCEYAERIVHLYPGTYHKGQHTNFLRNYWMVDNADFVVICESNTPGTQNCIQYVLQSGKEYAIL